MYPWLEWQKYTVLPGGNKPGFPATPLSVDKEDFQPGPETGLFPARSDGWAIVLGVAPAREFGRMTLMLLEQQRLPAPESAKSTAKHGLAQRGSVSSVTVILRGV